LDHSMRGAFYMTDYFRITKDRERHPVLKRTNVLTFIS
jgi:hypothetical protein